MGTIQKIRKAMMHAGNRKKEAANVLGISRATLWRAIREDGIQ